MKLHLLTASLMMAAAPAWATAQETRAPLTDVNATVVIGDTAAPPEWHLSVPIAVTVKPEAELGKLSLRLVYPAKVLQYTKVRPTDAAKRAGFDVTAGKPTISGDSASVVIEVTASGKDPKPLPSGTVAIVELKVDEDAPQKVWPISAENVRGWSRMPAAAEVKVAYEGPAKFLVTPPGLPILSCFFYMH